MIVVPTRGLSRGVSAVLLFLIYLFFLLSALLLGVSQWFLLVVLLVFGATVVLLFIGWRGIEDRHGWILVVAWCAMLFTPMIRHLSTVPVGYILEFFIFGLALAGIRRLWIAAGTDRVLRTLLVLLALHFVIALLSTFLGRSKTIAALWQFQYNLKWPLMFALGMFIVWSARTDGVVRGIVRYSWLFLLPVVAFEMIAPGAYMKVFGLSTDSNLNPILGTEVRHRGPFSNAGNLATISCLLSVAAIAQVLAGRTFWWLALAAVYGGLVIFTGQRQEIFALSASVLLFAAFYARRHLILMALGVAALGVVVLAVFVYIDYIPLQRTLIQWGLIDGVVPYSERAILTMKGLAVAQQYFPLGAGLGTYGGAGAQKFDLSLFLDLGFGKYWWFLQGKFLLDTYWPNIAAESGFLGALALVCFFALMWSTLLGRAWRSVDKPHYAFAFLGLCAFTLLILNTPSSQTLTDPRGAIVFWLIVGATWRLTSPVQGVRSAVAAPMGAYSRADLELRPAR